MTPTTWTEAVTHLGRLCGTGGETRPDGELLRRFVRDRDEAAFRALVARHGRLVWGVAARHAADRHAAEDAFQATFFALARLAGRLDGRGSLAGWLHTVAARTARRTRRRPVPVGPAAESAAPEADPLDALSGRELLAVLDEELGRLPDRYRQPVLLCCLEGLSRDEAAARLGWAVGSVKGRLERGRELLRRRLAARGVGLPAALAALAVTPAAVPAALLTTTADAAAGSAAVGGRAAALAGEVVRAATLPRRLLTVAALVAVVVVAGGIGSAVTATTGAPADPPKTSADEPGPTPADADPDARRVRVLADGKPAAGAKVWVFPEYHDPKAKPPAEPAPLVAGADGIVRVPLPLLLGRTTTVLFARDPAGRIGAYHHEPFLPPDRDLVINLVATTRLAGRVTDGDGRPIPGVELVTARFAPPAPALDIGYRSPKIVLPPWEAARNTVKTDPDGRFAFAGVPVGHLALVGVESAGHGKANATVRVGGPADLTLPKAGAIRVAFAGEGTAADTKGMGWSVNGGAIDAAKLTMNPGLGWYEPPAGAGVVLVSFASGTFDGSDRPVIANLPPGTYSLSCDGSAPALAKPAAKVVVTPGGTTDVTLTLTRLAKVTGRVVDAETGQPVPGADVYVHPPERTRDFPQGVTGWVKTDAAGRYTAYMPPGHTVSATVHSPPAGYLRPEYERGRLPTPDARLTTAGHAFPDIKLRKGTRFAATVVDDAGKPVSAVVYPGLMDFGAPTAVAAGADGTFALADLDPRDVVAPRVRRGNAVNIPKGVEVGDPGGPVTVAVSEANAFHLAGRVTDARGTPVAGAAVTIEWHYQGLGKSASYGSSRFLEKLTTAADGRFTSSALWPTDRYRATVAAEGYGKAESPLVLGVAGKTHDVADVRLTKSNLSVRGVVVDPAGNPVGGAVVFNRGDGETEVETTADAEGRFVLKGFRDGPAFVLARKDGYRTAAAPADPGGEPVRVVLRKLADPPAELPPDAGRAEALTRMTRHLLEALWAERAKLDGFERRVFDAMARLDPATARRWAAEAKGGKTDFAARLAKAEADRKLIEVAKADPEDAIARTADRKGRAGFEAVYDLAKALAASDKAKALRVAEEAVVRARELDMPQRAWWLGEAGFLVARCGNVAGGKAVIAEAATLAEKLPTDGLNGFYRGYVAGFLAPFDPKRAEAMLAAHTEADDYNRYLALAIDRVAVFDPAAARGLLDKFRAGNSFYQHEGRLFLAYRLAGTDPDAAAKLVAGVAEAKYRTLGYVKLARLVARKDRPGAWALIDTAFAQFDRDPTGFESWSNFGGPAAIAAAVAVAAKDLGHPDAAGGVVRALAVRPTVRAAGSPQYREEQAMKIALVLSFVDAPTAGRVLAGIAPPGEIADRAVTGGRDWLFAAALVWPDRAPAVIDRRLKTFLARKAGRGGVSDSGLIELLSTLTAADRLKDLGGWASLPRMNEEWEE